MAGRPAAAPDPRCRTGRVLCIGKTSRTLRWMVDGQTPSTMAVRFGTQYTPDPRGCVPHLLEVTTPCVDPL